MKAVWEGSTKSIGPSEDSIPDIGEIISIARAGVWIGSVLQDRRKPKFSLSCKQNVCKEDRRDEGGVLMSAVASSLQNELVLMGRHDD
jgi:hypothetical protein